MPTFQEIEDIKDLKRLSEELNRKISRQAKLHKTKTVGYPSGRADFPIHFASRKGENITWWASQPSENGDAFINLIGRGNPDSNDYLLIDLQFNIPIRRFGRSHGGAFVRDVESGAIYLAHRGIVTRGKSRVPKGQLLSETSATTKPVLGSNGPLQLFLVAAVDSPTLLDDISTFAQEIRRSADVVMNGSSERSSSSPSRKDSLDDTLGEYFDEFSGKRRLPPRKEAIAVVRHGSVVKQLAEAVKHLGRLHKSTLIDLAVAGKDCAYVFEVKTALDTTSIYTAIGQLCLHSLSVARNFRATRVRKIMVIPGNPSERVRNGLSTQLGIEVLSFSWVGRNGIKFDANSLTR